MEAGANDGRPKILFFTVSLGHGGAEMHLARLLNHLDLSRFDVAAAVLRGGGTYEAIVRESIAVHHLPVPVRSSSTLRIMRSKLAIRQFVHELQPDLVCSVMAAAGIAMRRALRGLPSAPPHVVSVQSPPIVSHRMQNRSRGRAKRLVREFFLRQTKRLLADAQHVIAISDGVARDVAQLWPPAGERTTVIYNAAFDDDLARHAAEQVDIPPGPPLLIACGRLVEQKGFSYLLQAINLLRKHREVRLWIIGEGPLRPALTRKIVELELGDHVALLGFKENPYKYMAAGDVFVLSSIFEGFGNVVAEAMAAGAPVVATDCPYGPGEIVSNGETGLLVVPGSANALAEGIDRLLSDAAFRDDLARAGQRRAQAFSSANAARAHERLFDTLLGTADSGRN